MSSIGVWTSGLDAAEPDGPSLALHRMLRELSQLNRGFDLTCIHTDSDSNEQIYEEFSELVIKKNLRGAKQIREARFDAVLINGIPTTIPSALFHQLNTNADRIAWVHGTLPWVVNYAYGDKLQQGSIKKRGRNRMTKAIMRTASRYFETVVANSNFTRSVLTDSLGVPESRTWVAKYGVDHDVFREYSESELESIEDYKTDHKDTLIYVSNNIERKGPDTVVDAYTRIAENRDDTRLLIVGGGYRGSSIQKTVQNSSHSEDVTFTGFLDETTVAKLYNISTILLFPTLHETFGMPILESMASGTPVISSNCTAIPEIAGDAAVLLDDPTDSVELAERTIELLDDEERQNQLTTKGIERVSEFHWRHTAEKFKKLFESATL